MSRSKKKIGIYKDKTTYGKKLGNKKFRRKSKSITKKIKDTDNDMLLPEDKSEVINDYDVCDYKFFSKDKKAKRK